MLLSILNQLPPQSLCPLLGRDEQHFQILAFYPHKRDGSAVLFFCDNQVGNPLKCSGNIFFDIPNFLIHKNRCVALTELSHTVTSRSMSSGFLS